MTWNYEKSLGRTCVRVGTAVSYKDACNRTNLCKKVSCLIITEDVGVLLGFTYQLAKAEVELTWRSNLTRRTSLNIVYVSGNNLKIYI